MVVGWAAKRARGFGLFGAVGAVGWWGSACPARYLIGHDVRTAGGGGLPGCRCCSVNIYRGFRKVRLRFVSKVLRSASIPLILAAWTANAEDQQEFRLSIATIAADLSDRVAEFQLHIKGALVVSFPHVPVGWAITIDNDPSWNAEVSGVAIVGAAYLAPGELRSDFLAVRGMPGELRKYPGAPQGISVTGYIVLYKADLSKRVELSNQDFVLAH